MPTSTERLAEQIAALRSRLDRTARSPQLANSSIENASLKVKDAAGATTLIIGVQYDGTSVASSVGGPAPPQPNPATLTSLVGGFKVRWDGTYPADVDGALQVAPMDFARVEIHASATSGFTPSFATKEATIESAGGGDLTIGWEVENQNVYVKLVTVSLSGRSSTASTQAGPVLAQGAATTTDTGDLQTQINTKANTSTTATITTTNALDTRLDAVESGKASVSYADSISSRVGTLESDSGWITFSPNAPVSAGSAGCAYRKVGDIVFISCHIDYASNFSDPFTLVTLPSGYRPSREIYFNGMFNSGMGPVRIKVFNTGAVLLTTATTTPPGGLVMSGSWPA